MFRADLHGVVLRHRKREQRFVRQRYSLFGFEVRVIRGEKEKDDKEIFRFEIGQFVEKLIVEKLGKFDIDTLLHHKNNVPRACGA